MKTWTFITVTYNSARALSEFWNAPVPDSVEWIVVDNASTDNTLSIIDRLEPSTVIRLEQNVGFGAANNVGLEQATGRYVCFVNPDVRVDYSSLAVLQEELDVRGGIVGPQLLNSDGSLQPGGRGFPTLANKIRNRVKSEKGPGNYQIYAQEGEVKYVCWVIGAAVCCQTEEARALGGWDELFFVYYEDSDLGLRAWQTGKSVRLMGDVRWTHGWARDTAKFRIGPWRRELPSLVKFYWRYPMLALTTAQAVKRYPRIAARMGKDARPSISRTISAKNASIPLAHGDAEGAV